MTLFGGTCSQVPYLTIGPYVAEGTVEDRRGAMTLTARRSTRADRRSGSVEPTPEV